MTITEPLTAARARRRRAAAERSRARGRTGTATVVGADATLCRGPIAIPVSRIERIHTPEPGFPVIAGDGWVTVMGRLWAIHPPRAASR